MIIEQIPLAPALRNALASPVQDDDLATTADYAAMTFDGFGPEIEAAVGSRREWTEKMASHYPTVRLATASLRRNHEEAYQAVVAVGADTMTDFAVSIAASAEYFQALAETLRCAQLRAMGALCRFSIATGVEV